MCIRDSLGDGVDELLRGEPAGAAQVARALALPEELVHDAAHVVGEGDNLIGVLVRRVERGGVLRQARAPAVLQGAADNIPLLDSSVASALVGQAFERLDKDGSGTVDKKEMVTFIKVKASSSSCSETENLGLAFEEKVLSRNGTAAHRKRQLVLWH